MIYTVCIYLCVCVCVCVKTVKMLIPRVLNAFTIYFTSLVTIRKRKVSSLPFCSITLTSRQCMLMKVCHHYSMWNVNYQISLICCSETANKNRGMLKWVDAFFIRTCWDFYSYEDDFRFIVTTGRLPFIHS